MEKTKMMTYKEVGDMLDREEKRFLSWEAKTYTMEEMLVITAQDIEEQVYILRQNLKRKKSHTLLEYV